MERQREKLGSRIGFIFLSAACAIGLGNVWRFPYITGKYGGAAFLVLYLAALLLLGLPLLVMELAVGRGAGLNLVGAFRKLAGKHPRIWALFGKIFFSGNVLLMMFYSTVCGWVIAYAWYYLSGKIVQCPDASAVGALFVDLTRDPWQSTLFMGLGVGIATIVCAAGLKNGVERIVKAMMLFLLAILLVLAVRALTMNGAAEALRFYLLPDFSSWRGARFFDVLFAAVGQAFFTLSIGIGSMAIFGSYIDKEYSLTNESGWIVALDTGVALVAGLIIFPICFTFGIRPGEGPALVFVSMPNIFREMSFGRLWGFAFFLFMTFAALTTVIAVFENMIAYLMDEHGFSRRRASATVGSWIFLLSLPCAWGFSLLRGVEPMGKGSSILDLEDFIVSQNMLPLGALCILCFCLFPGGWGMERFLKEANAGTGIAFPARAARMLRWLLPPVFAAIFLAGYWVKFFR